jgi:hypothetical protein
VDVPDGNQNMKASAKTPAVWLFPVTYLLHLCEEYWGGEGFPAWISQLADVSLTRQEFVIMNSVGFVLMTIGAVLIAKNNWRWLLTAFGGIVLLNGALHLVSSVVTWSYSPGLISGVLCWLPLGGLTIYRQSQQAARRSFTIGIVLALVLHGLVTLLALYA